MSWITENPFWICSTGIFLGVVFLVLFVHTQNARFLLLTLVSGLVVVGGFTIEQLIVTDKESVETVVKELAQQVRENDMQAILDRVSADHRNCRKDVEWIMSHCDFSGCSVTQKPEFLVISDTAAEVEFTVFVSVKESPYGAASDNVRIRLVLAKQGDRWMIEDYGYKTRHHTEFHRR